MTTSAGTPVNPSRIDPYKDFKYRVLWEGRVVAGFSKVTPLKRSSDAQDKALPGTARTRSKYDVITLERGVTHDPGFQQWLSQTAAADLTVEEVNEAGKVLQTHAIGHVIPSAIESSFSADAKGKTLAISHMKLQSGGTSH